MEISINTNKANKSNFGNIKQIIKYFKFHNKVVYLILTFLYTTKNIINFKIQTKAFNLLNPTKV